MEDAIAALALGSCLILLAWIDARRMILPDTLTLALAATGLLAAFHAGAPEGVDAILASLLGGILFWLVRALHFRWRHVEGLGLGDVKLVAAGGPWTGLEGLPIMLLVGTASAVMFIAIQGLRGHKISAQTAIPFGPFLCLGIAAAWAAPRLFAP
jgi:leader peptidase (prepilin peptidase)/N-methyltransferase